MDSLLGGGMEIEDLETESVKQGHAQERMVVIKTSQLPCELLIIIILILQMRKQTLSNLTKLTQAAAVARLGTHTLWF